VVFPLEDWRFAVLICFEDGFGYLAREQARQGAQILVNMTNDSWGRSFSCQMQHLAMSVFRAVENRRAVARAATSGQTCVIDPNGRIVRMGKPFTALSFTADAPLASNETFYTRHGDYFPIVCALFLMTILLHTFITRPRPSRRLTPRSGLLHIRSICFTVFITL
jgi:apolipoprotein N-acyltransferase